MSFKDNQLKQLAIYKNKILKISQDGVFNYRGKIIYKAHILPINMIKKNIIIPYRQNFYNSNYSDIKFHRFFHHLNSSQALCINLFYPLIKENKFNVISNNLLGIKKFLPIKYCFEKESNIEQVIHGGLKTNFDFYTQDNQTELFFEIKFTENVFGKSQKDKRHKEKFKLTYTRLLNNNPYINSEYCNVDEFLEHYQIRESVEKTRINSYLNRDNLLIGIY